MMILGRRKQVGGKCFAHRVLLFGIGLVGGEILRAARKRADFTICEMSFSWTRPDKWAQEIADILHFIEQSDGKSNTVNVRRVDTVWAAGTAGFAASAAEMDLELAAFDEILGFAANLCMRLPNARHVYHLMSSAGGLFEGQRFVGLETTPKPQRPYGAAKLAQERRLSALTADIDPMIYRLSSVYGCGGPGTRAGLANVVIANTVEHKVSYIFGRLDTLRDYVLVQDIGEFIGDRLCRDEINAGTFLLASGKPTSMYELLRIGRHAIGKHLYLRFDPRPPNAQHITFAPAALPSGWYPTDLQTGIRRTALNMLSSFIDARRSRSFMIDQRYARA